MKNPNQKRKRDHGPVVKRRHDELGEAFPNDWLEAVIVLAAMTAMGGGAWFLYYLSTQVN